MSEQEEPGGNRRTKEGIGMKTIKTCFMGHHLPIHYHPATTIKHFQLQCGLVLYSNSLLQCGLDLCSNSLHQCGSIET